MPGNVVRSGELLIQYLDDTSEWRQRPGDRRGKVEFGESAEEAVSSATPNAKSGSADDGSGQ
jgi:hypothetical protein